MAIPETDKKTTLFLAAVVLILLGIMVYVFNRRVFRRQRAVIPVSPYQQEIGVIETQSGSDDVQSIEYDLNTTDLNNLDKELTDIQNELNSTY